MQPTDGDVTVLLTKSLAGEVAAVSGCQVVSQLDLTQMLDFEAEQAARGDVRESCLSEIGSALGAERIVGGTLGRLGGDFVLSAKLMNVRDGTVQARAEQVVHGAVEHLRPAAKDAARQRFGLAVEPAVALPAAPAVASPSTSPATSVLWWAGVVTAAAGGLVVVVGGATAGLAEAQLAVAAEGRTTLAVVAVGRGLVVVVGGLVVVVALLPE
ncbi:MAG: hypothetical protein FJ137_01205 [Deltaproteobacteria bacterium]|nr:hypothetical protein [Deltaproteobacteria bacterium]